jgi:hypothetical protein
VSPPSLPPHAHGTPRGHCRSLAAMPSSARVFSCASGTFCVIFTMWEEGKEIYLRCKGMALLSTRGRFDFRRRSGDGILSSWCYRSCFRIIVVALLFEKMLELSPVKQQRLAQTIITAFKHRFAASTTTDNLSSVSQSYALGSNHIFY